MKKLIAIVFFFCTNLTLYAQNECEAFRAYLYNKEYQLFIKIDLCDENVTIPGQDLLGQLPGYIGRKQNSFCWIITSAEIKDQKAHLTLINDYGSEDFTATLTHKNDSTYELTYTDGSTFKMPYNGKWQKMPKKMEFIRSSY